MSKCPVCGEYAYVGFSHVECSSESCKFFDYKAKAEHEAEQKKAEVEAALKLARECAAISTPGEANTSGDYFGESHSGDMQDAAADQPLLPFMHDPPDGVDVDLP